MSFLEWMRQQGAPAEVIAEAERAERERMMQQDYTRKTQELSEKERQLAFLAGQIQSQQGTAGGPRRKVDEVLASYANNADGQAVAQYLQPLVDAIYQDVEGRFGTETQQLREVMSLVAQRTELSDRLKQELLPKYGEGVLEALPKVEQKAREALYNRQSFNPEQLLWDVAGDVAAKARQTKEDNEAKARQRSTLAGFEQVSRTSPPASGGALAMQQATGPQGGPSASAPAFDPAATYLQIMEEIGAGT